MRLAARDLLDQDPKVRHNSRLTLLADPKAADPILTELIFRNRSRHSIEAASVLFALDTVRGAYAILALCADEYMVRWYEQPLAAALGSIPDDVRMRTLEDALDRIANRPCSVDWAYALATNSICSLQVKPLRISSDLWNRILRTPADTASEWALWRCLISYQPRLPAPPANLEAINSNAALSLRVAAVETILTVEQPRALALFANAVAADDINAHAAVIYGLLRLHNPKHIPLLHAIISSSRHPLQRDAIIVAKAIGADVTDVLTLVRPAGVAAQDYALLLKSATTTTSNGSPLAVDNTE